MKISKLGFMLLFLFSATLVLAQEVTWGPEHRQPKRDRLDRIIGEDNKGIYVLKYKNRLLGGPLPVIEHYNQKMVLKYATPLKELGNFNIVITNAWQFNDKLFLFYTRYTSRKRQQELFIQEVDKKTGKLIGKKDYITGMQAINRADLGHLEYAASPDSARALIFAQATAVRGLLQKPRDTEFALEVVDENFKKVWNKNVRLPYREDLFDVERVEVDREGNAFILARIYNQRRQNQKKGRVNYQYKIISYQDNGQKLVEYELSIKDKFITELTFKINRNKQITCAGFYSERRTSNSIKGTCFFLVDMDSKKIINQNTKAFDKKFLSKLMSKRRARKGRELYRYYLDEIILRSDGGAVLIGEQFYVVTQTYYTGTGLNRTENVTYTYHYEDIIIININPDGTIAWATNVPKDQQSSTTEFSSYAHMIVKGKIHFIYNDRISRRSPVMHATVNTAGDVQIKELFKNKDAGILTKPPLCKQTSRDEMVIFGERGRRFKFGKITVEN